MTTNIDLDALRNPPPPSARVKFVDRLARLDNETRDAVVALMSDLDRNPPEIARILTDAGFEVQEGPIRTWRKKNLTD